MDKVNLNFSGCDNIIKSICWILSVLSWLMYLICGWISIRWLDTGKYYHGLVMTIYRMGYWKNLDNKTVREIYPLQLQTAVLYIVIIVTMIFALVGFIVYMVKSTCKKCEVFDKMMDTWTRWHWAPILIASGLFLIGIVYCDTRNPKWKDANIAGCILVILGLAGLIVMYIKTDLPDDWFTATIKKGAYSTLIALEWYYFCYLICNLANIDHLNDLKKTNDDIKGCGIAMPIIEGVGALVFAFFFKDVIIAFMNVLIFIGAAAYYLSIHKDYRKKDLSNGHGPGEGIIDIIFMVLAVVVIVVLIIMKKKECLK